MYLLYAGVTRKKDTCLPSQEFLNLGHPVEGQPPLLAYDTKPYFYPDESQCGERIHFVHNWLRWDWLRQPPTLTPVDMAQPNPRSG